MRPHIHSAYVFLLFLFAIGSRAYGFSLRCASVGTTGDVTITWDRTGLNGANFRSWHIYHSQNSAGPFTRIDSTFLFNDTIQTHLTANAANVGAHYYISFQPTTGSAVISDTIRAIGLNVVNPNNGFANLSWNPTRVPLVSTNFPFYRIFREYPAGTFTLIDSINATTAPVPMTYSDLISICDDTIKYRIEVMDQSGCVSVSPIKGDRFRDLQPPSQPEIDSVSVDINGNVIVAWKPSPSLDTRLYQVLQSLGGLWVAIDTVYGRSSTVYYSAVSGSSQSVAFQVIAKDSCNNPSAQSNEHRTIFARAAFEVCGAKVTLSWNAYTYWGGPTEYEILVSQNGGPESLIGVTSATTFVDTALVSGVNFCYRVRAREISTRRSSTSNRACIIPAFPPPPAFSYVKRVTVTGESQVYISAHVDATASVRGYQLQRSMSLNGPFTTINTQNISGVSLVEFFDNSVETVSGPYYYRIITLDSCGIISKVSNVSRTIVASVTTADYINDLRWSTYLQWPGGVQHYNIYRSINGVFDTSPTFTQSSFFADSSRSDEILQEYVSDGEFCYFIEAVEAGGNPFGFRDTSRSNIVCVKVEPLIFIPNAFHPDGDFNKVWNPSNAFVSEEGYELRVFDRWGKTIFTSNDPLKGWDGTINGSFAPVGVYVYQLRAQTAEGGKINKTGSVTLIQ